MGLPVLIGSGIAFLLGIDMLYAGYVERRRIPRVINRFETGTRDLQLDTKNFFPRDQETVELTKLITPSTPGFFNLITGEHGTGKTILVCNVCKNAGEGVLYIRVPDNPILLARTLGDVVDFDFEVNISFWSQLRFPPEGMLLLKQDNLQVELTLKFKTSHAHQHSRWYWMVSVKQLNAMRQNTANLRFFS